MAAINYDFSIEQGSPFTLNFQYNDSTNNAISLNNSCIIMSCVPNIGPRFNITSSGQNNFFTISSNTLGFFTLQIPDSVTSTYNWDTANYDLDIVTKNLATNTVINNRISTGTINLIKRITPVPINCEGSVVQNAIPTLASISGNIIQLININELNSVKTIADSRILQLSDPPPGSPTSPDSPPILDNVDLCTPVSCLNLDIYSTVYDGSSITINDLSISSGSVYVSTTGIMENIEIAINGLVHASKQDLQLFLSPPTGNMILLAANNKASVNNFMFSNKAGQNTYMHNVTDGGYCNIYNKVPYTNFNNQILESGMSHLIGQPIATGLWTLLIRDTDPTISGILNKWNLVITRTS